MKNLFLALVAIFAVATVANAQSTATATAKATIICPLSITHDNPTNQPELNFGCLVNSGAVGTAHMTNDNSNTRTTGGGLTGYVGANCTEPVTEAVFTVRGEGGWSYNVSIPDVSGSGWSFDFSYNEMSINPSQDNTMDDNGAIDTYGSVIIGGGPGCQSGAANVGGTFNDDGTFYGVANPSFNVTVAYN